MAKWILNIKREKKYWEPYQTERILCLFHYGNIKVFHFLQRHSAISPPPSAKRVSAPRPKGARLHFGQSYALKFCLLPVGIVGSSCGSVEVFQVL